jgi:hypothetical protein
MLHDYATLRAVILALATLGGTAQIKTVLFVLHHPR